MAENSKIEWTDHTFNPWIGCTRVSLGCDGCYAAVSTPARAMGVKWGATEQRHRTAPSTWKQPEKWERNHEAFFAEHSRRQRVFCASLADVFDNAVPAAWRADLLHLIVDTPHLDWLLLTKRIGNAHAMLNEAAAQNCMPRWGDAMFGNVWLGATVVNQEEADRDIPKLLATPARVRFLSCEPLLGPIELRQRGYFDFCERPDRTGFADGTHVLRPPIDWVIVGGESGPGARPMHPDWARSLRDQCAAAAVPFLFKQWGEWAPWPDHPARNAGAH